MTDSNLHPVFQEIIDSHIHSVVCCAEYKEQELIEEMQREQHLHNLQWHENMNSLYTWDEGGFCDGFTK